MSLPAPDPIIRRKLSDEVFDRLKSIIASGEVPPGETMPSERELMERFGVGRPVIREAMQALSNLGLLSISHGERAKVRRLTARSVVQQVDAAATIMLSSSPDSLGFLKEARLFFERGMVRRRPNRRNRDDLARLQAILAEQRDALGDAEAFIAADMRFHTQLAAISRNPIFEAVSEAMLTWLKQYHTELLIWSGKENLTLIEHDAIADRVAAHDPDGAETELVRHLTRSAALYVHTIA